MKSKSFVRAWEVIGVSFQYKEAKVSDCLQFVSRQLELLPEEENLDHVNCLRHLPGLVESARGSNANSSFRLST
jgi:hypothetical protein